MYEYKKLSFKTIKDIEKIERLVIKGWKVISVGLDTILLEK